jgi:hypothetical protein
MMKFLRSPRQISPQTGIKLSAVLTASLFASSAFAQTATTRSSTTVYSSYSIYAQQVDTYGKPINGSWSEFGNVKFDVAVSEPSQGKLSYRISRVQPVATYPNTTLTLTQQGCVIEPINNQERLRCFYTAKATVNSNISGLKLTTTWKGGGAASVGAEIPKGANFKADANGEQGGELALDIKPGFSFSRSFEFVVQLRNSCTNYPAYSVYYQGNGDYPTIQYAQCLNPMPKPPEYCGTGSVQNRLPNGAIDGVWKFESEDNPWKTLTNRTYRLYRNSVATNQTYVKTCAVNLSSCHVFESVDWYNQFKHTNFTWIRTGPNWCSWYSDRFQWNDSTGGYTTPIGNNLYGGCGCPDATQQAPVFAPSRNF